MGAKKSLGQHFLVDDQIIGGIIAATLPEPRQIIEIGPGKGALTTRLLDYYDNMTLIEKDREFADNWRKAGLEKVTVLEQDATDPKWIEYLIEPSYGVVSNLPYNASTPILRLLLSHHDLFPWMVLMFQLEVADRLLYAGSRRGGPLGVLTQMVYSVDNIVEAGPDAFSPPPRVNSRVLRLKRIEHPLPADKIGQMWKLLVQLFQRRRSRLDKIVSRIAAVDRETVQRWFADLEIREDARADHVSADQYWRLAERIGV